MIGVISQGRGDILRVQSLYCCPGPLVRRRRRSVEVSSGKSYKFDVPNLCVIRPTQVCVHRNMTKTRIPRELWGQIKTAYASGIGLRELARNMQVPAGTVLARAKREGWTQQIAAAKLIEHPHLAREIAKPDAINAITPMQSVAS